MRQRAVICQDCWFWKEMSCALASPADGVCANKRPVQGRRASRPAPAQASLVPLAAGHAAVADEPSRPAVAAKAPFAADAPEATFSMAQLRETAPEVPPVAPAARVQPIRTAPPSFREIRAGRAAAASRAPVAEVRIPLDELEVGTLVSDAAHRGQTVVAPPLAGMDGLVERVRQRTAARISRAGAFSPA